MTERKIIDVNVMKRANFRSMRTRDLDDMCMHALY